MKRIFTKLLAFVAVGVCLCTLPPSVSAGITLPFSTTYNCPEQQQGSTNPFWVTCDGISKAGDWTTKNGSKEQITSAANYPGGGGGRGQRHRIGDSGAPVNNTNNSGGVSFSFNTRHNEVYIRFYVRWEAGMIQGGAIPEAKVQSSLFCRGCVRSAGRMLF